MTVRTLEVTRTYALGDYENLKVTEKISDIPEKDFAKLEDLYRGTMLLGIEETYLNYRRVSSEHSLNEEENIILDEMIKVKKGSYKKLEKLQGDVNYEDA